MRKRLILVKAVKPKTLSNYGASLLRFTQFCDSLCIPEAMRMPEPKWLLSVVITIYSTGLVGAGSIRTWLLGIQLWHVINSAPWHGTTLLKHDIQGSVVLAPSSASHPRCAPIIIAHLRALRNALDLNMSDAAVFTTATMAFLCQCQLTEVCFNALFNPTIHASRSSLQKAGKTASTLAAHAAQNGPSKTTGS